MWAMMGQELMVMGEVEGPGSDAEDKAERN